MILSMLVYLWYNWGNQSGERKHGLSWSMLVQLQKCGHTGFVLITRAARRLVVGQSRTSLGMNGWKKVVDIVWRSDMRYTREIREGWRDSSSRIGVFAERNHGRRSHLSTLTLCGHWDGFLVLKYVHYGHISALTFSLRYPRVFAGRQFRIIFF